MISYYKKVFLASLRFSFLDGLLSFGKDLFGSVLGGASDAAGGAVSGLFGGSTSTGNKGLDIKNRQDDIAGGGGQNSAKMVESISATAGRNIGQFGQKMAGELMEGITKKFVGNKIDNMFQKSPGQLGTEQRLYNASAYPGTNPWEQMGGSGQGQGISGVQAQRTSARAKRSASVDAAQAPLKNVNIEYQKMPSAIAEKTATAGLKTGQTRDVAEDTLQKQALNKSLKLLELATGAERGLRYQKADVDTAISKATYQKDKIQPIADAKVKELIQAGYQASIKTGLQKSNAELAKAQAKVATALTKGNRSDYVAAAIALGAITAGITRSIGMARGATKFKGGTSTGLKKK